MSDSPLLSLPTDAWWLIIVNCPSVSIHMPVTCKQMSTQLPLLYRAKFPAYIGSILSKMNYNQAIAELNHVLLGNFAPFLQFLSIYKFTLDEATHLQNLLFGVSARCWSHSGMDSLKWLYGRVHVKWEDVGNGEIEHAPYEMNDAIEHNISVDDPALIKVDTHLRIYWGDYWKCLVNGDKPRMREVIVNSPYAAQFIDNLYLHEDDIKAFAHVPNNIDDPHFEKLWNIWMDLKVKRKMGKMKRAIL